MIRNFIGYELSMASDGARKRGVFIGYRREDASGHAGRLYDLLAERFGAEHVFIDVDTVEAGSDFRSAIEQALDASAIFLALVGPRWVGHAANGTRRIDDEADTVRREIEGALARRIPIIPVLLQGALLPSADQLPETLQPLTARNWVRLDDARWRSDADYLSRAVRTMLGDKESRDRLPRAAKRLIRRAVVLMVIATTAVSGFVILRDESQSPSAPSPSEPSSSNEPIASLLRSETEVTRVIREYLDRDGIEELILLSSTLDRGEFGSPQQFVDVFKRDPAGNWIRIFDATTYTPYGDPESPPLIQLAPEVDAVIQRVAFIGTIDFFRDGGSELVLGIQIAAGASAGPFALTVVSFEARRGVGNESSQPETVFQYRVPTGGALVSTTPGGNVRLESGKYGPRDAHCCPSATLRLEIGARGREVAILEREIVPNGD